MPKSRLYHFALAFMAIWFLAVQSFSTAHAASHGEHPHEHDGVSCAVLALAEDDLAVAPDIEVPSFVPLSPQVTAFPSHTPISYEAPQTRAPPPRAPPFFH